MKRALLLRDVHTDVDSDAALHGAQRKRVKQSAVSIADEPPRRCLRATAQLPPHQLVLAPMVGGSELPFRLLARRYNAQLCYTPMLYSARFVEDAEYRTSQLRGDDACADAPLVVHFCGNDPDVLVAAGRLAAKRRGVVAVDLNLGCPQRVAHAGNFGSYLCATQAGRDTALRCVAAMARHLPVPVFAKIRLLDEGVDDTVAFCRQLRDAGAALLAVHARYRGSPTRRRDGPADLDAVKTIKAALPDMPVLSNGNVRDAKDLLAALATTGADGVMSAEGALDDPALFARAAMLSAKRRRKLRKVLKTAQEGTPAHAELRAKLRATPKLPALDVDAPPDKLALAAEYMHLAQEHGEGGPATMTSARFHVRRMCRDQLAERRLGPLLDAATDMAHIAAIVHACAGDAESHSHALAELSRIAAWERCNARRRAEFMGRMKRKARREGKPDDFYLSSGSTPPTQADVAALRDMAATQRLSWWNARFGQHCMALHAEGVCARARSEYGCAYLHVPATPAGAAEPLASAPSWLRENGRVGSH